MDWRACSSEAASEDNSASRCSNMSLAEEGSKSIVLSSHAVYLVARLVVGIRRFCILRDSGNYRHAAQSWIWLPPRLLAESIGHSRRRLQCVGPDLAHGIPPRVARPLVSHA